MMWLLLNCVFGGAYAYTTQKEKIVKQASGLWAKAMESIMGMVEKIPKYKTE